MMTRTFRKVFTFTFKPNQLSWEWGIEGICLKPNKAELFESSFLWGDQFDAIRWYQTLPYYDRNNEKKGFDVQLGWGNINVEYLSHDYLHGNSFNIR